MGSGGVGAPGGPVVVVLKGFPVGTNLWTEVISLWEYGIEVYCGGFTGPVVTYWEYGLAPCDGIGGVGTNDDVTGACE